MARRPIKRSWDGRISSNCRSQRCMASGKTRYGNPSRTKTRPMRVTSSFIQNRVPEPGHACNQGEQYYPVFPSIIPGITEIRSPCCQKETKFDKDIDNGEGKKVS